MRYREEKSAETACRVARAAERRLLDRKKANATRRTISAGIDTLRASEGRLCSVQNTYSTAWEICSGPNRMLGAYFSEIDVLCESVKPFRSRLSIVAGRVLWRLGPL